MYFSKIYLFLIYVILMAYDLMLYVSALKYVCINFTQKYNTNFHSVGEWTLRKNITSTDLRKSSSWNKKDKVSSFAETDKPSPMLSPGSFYGIHCHGTL